VEPPPSRILANHHAVQFYGNEQSLFVTVADFLSEGLVAGQPAIIIATEPHRLAIVEHLASRLIDVEQAQRIGDLVLLDAEELLATFMVGDTPDRTSFESHVGGVIERVLAGRPQTVTRAYGEMVDLLWKDGRSEAAIRVEILWNALATKYEFALLCGYSMGNFYKQTEQFRAVCEQHTHVIEPETNVVPFERKRPARSA
jgi:hypothetical protein